MKVFKKLGQKGFSHLELILIVITIVVVAGIYLGIKSQADPKSTSVPVVQLTANVPGAVYLSWGNSSNPGAAYYEVWRDNTLSYKTTNTYIIDRNVVANTSYTYKVAAVLSDGTVAALSQTLSLTTPSFNQALVNLNSAKFSSQSSSSNVTSHASSTRSLPIEFKTNWSGYVANSSRQFNSVQFSFTIPRVKCLVNNSDVSIWGGIDGSKTSTVEQSGISANCNYNSKRNLVPSYYAWTDMYPGYQNPLALVVHPSDSLTFHTYLATNGKFDFYIKDLTTKRISNTQYSCSQNGGYPCKRLGAEWIVERNILCQNVSCTKHTILPLTDYGTINITGTYATTINGSSTALGSYQNVPIYMTSSNYSKYLSTVNNPIKNTATGFSAHWLASQ